MCRSANESIYHVVEYCLISRHAEQFSCGVGKIDRKNHPENITR